MNNSQGLLFSNDNKLNAVKKIIIFYRNNLNIFIEDEINDCFRDDIDEIYNILLKINPKTLKEFITDENNDLGVELTLYMILTYVQQNVKQNNINIGIDIDKLISYVDGLSPDPRLDKDFLRKFI